MAVTGVWHGLYSYDAAMEPVYFVATIISSGDALSGTTHECVSQRRGEKLTILASIEGRCAGSSVNFTKTYLNAPPEYSFAVSYKGTLSADQTEIEGSWTIYRFVSGRFLMIRGESITESIVRRAYEPV